MRYRRFVETRTCIDIDGVQDVLGGFGGIRWRREGRFVMSCWGEEQTSICGESETAEKGGHRFIVIEICVPHGHSHRSIETG